MAAGGGVGASTATRRLIIRAAAPSAWLIIRTTAAAAWLIIGTTAPATWLIIGTAASAAWLIIRTTAPATWLIIRTTAPAAWLIVGAAGQSVQMLSLHECGSQLPAWPGNTGVACARLGLVWFHGLCDGHTTVFEFNLVFDLHG
jgi:hypothetical protein